tara:strand:+ start:430 stop:738 length:309 start_codon:yes stop_codon:yes gene_type:complete|eukprot:scaffold33268_cov69-Phaeocystis_antarctica.AAC.4
MLSFAVASCGMSDSKRALVGINNAMPGPGGVDPRGYVIVGAHADWSSAPVTLTLASKDYAVVSETYDFMARGLTLADGSAEATITCEDGTAVACVINVETVW